MLTITIVGNSGHDGDYHRHGYDTFQRALQSFMNENDGQSDCITIVIQKSGTPIHSDELRYVPVQS